MTPPNTTPLNEEDRLGEILKPLSDNGYHNNSEDSTRSTCYDCKRIETAKQELTNLIQTIEKKAAIMGAKYGNAAFRQYNIANPGKPINLDETLRMGIEQATAWVEGKV